MKALPVVLLLMLTASVLAEPNSASIAETSQPGTLLFSKGDCLAVRVFTGSSYTHVAMICSEGKQLYVYDANPGSGVRRQTLDEYIASIAPDHVQVLQPRRHFTPQEQEQLQAYLSGQVGTPYAVLHHSTGHRAEGVHCAEYMTDALMEVKWIVAQSPPRVSPGSLLLGLIEGDVYRMGASYDLQEPASSVPVGRNSCEQMWLNTKACCSKCCRQMSRWFLCR